MLDTKYDSRQQKKTAKYTEANDDDTPREKEKVAAKYKKRGQNK